jgi:hypothetical protein
MIEAQVFLLTSMIAGVLKVVSSKVGLMAGATMDFRRPWTNGLDSQNTVGLLGLESRVSKRVVC